MAVGRSVGLDRHADDAPRSRSGVLSARTSPNSDSYIFQGRQSRPSRARYSFLPSNKMEMSRLLTCEARPGRAREVRRPGRRTREGARETDRGEWECEREAERERGQEGRRRESGAFIVLRDTESERCTRARNVCGKHASAGNTSRVASAASPFDGTRRVPFIAREEGPLLYRTGGQQAASPRAWNNVIAG